MAFTFSTNLSTPYYLSIPSTPGTLNSFISQPPFSTFNRPKAINLAFCRYPPPPPRSRCLLLARSGNGGGPSGPPGGDGGAGGGGGDDDGDAAYHNRREALLVLTEVTYLHTTGKSIHPANAIYIHIYTYLFIYLRSFLISLFQRNG